MHNIKDIRKDIDNFKNTIKNRNVDVDFDQILNLDEENRKLIQEKEKLEMEKKSISKSKDETLFEKSKEISNKIDDLSKNQKNVKDLLDKEIVPKVDIKNNFLIINPPNGLLEL